MSEDAHAEVVPARESLAFTVYPARLRESILAAKKVDTLQIALSQFPQANMPIEHRHTPHLMSREIRVPAGTMVVTKIHKTEHQYIVSEGTLSVWVDGVGIRRISAPYHGITLPGTRRVCYCHTDVVWTTFHATDETDPEKLEDEVIFKYDPVLDSGANPPALLAEEMVRSLLLTLPE